MFNLRKHGWNELTVRGLQFGEWEDKTERRMKIIWHRKLCTCLNLYNNIFI